MFAISAAGNAASDSLMRAMLTLELFTQADDTRPVFVTGNFNGWRTKDDRFRMNKIAEGHYQYTFGEPLTISEPLEYKYVKGGWESEELGADGHPPINRRMVVPRGKVTDTVPKWKKTRRLVRPRFLPRHSDHFSQIQPAATAPPPPDFGAAALELRSNGSPLPGALFAGWPESF
jgi:hypothetical protein